MSFFLIGVFFIYGLAFFTLGLAMLLESGRSPLMAEGRVLRPLAFFGLVHGSHEWLEVVIAQQAWFGVQIPGWVGGVRLVVLAVSFAFLVWFGLLVLRPLKTLAPPRLTLLSLSLGAYLLLMVLAGLEGINLHPNWLAFGDASIRYLLAVPGAVLAALALLWQSEQAGSAGRPRLAGSLKVAALGFGLYALTQVFVPPSGAFPANWLNTATFARLTGFPIQVLRAATAVATNLALLRATFYADQARQEQFVRLQLSRLEALEQVRQDLVEREAMRRELLRHTVLAQEEERARLARELHDETAQVLTAFTLHLAALREVLAGPGRAAPASALPYLENLNTLSHQMSKGLYRMVHDLRPAQLDDLGLPAALQWLAEEERKTHQLVVSVETRGPSRRLDPVVETVLFRVAQEALANVARHARVKEATLLLLFEAQSVVLRVEDCGAGFDPTERRTPPRGWGLAGMYERAESVSGELRLRSAPGEGATIEVSIPLDTR